MSAPDPKTPPVLPWRGETTRHRSGWPEGYWRKVVWRGLRLRCPVCGKGKLFRTYFTMHECCPCCGVGFAREHGQWVGSLDINTFGVALLVHGGDRGPARHVSIQPRTVDGHRAPDRRGVLGIRGGTFVLQTIP